MKILFVCDYNEGRSQIAEAFFKRLSKKNECFSAGITTKSVGLELKDVNPRAIRFMDELGIDIRAQKVKQLTEEDAENADRIVIMSDRTIPDYLLNSKKSMRWDVKDFAPDDDEYRALRDKIKNLVDVLISEIG